jgi:hypothetical protein
LPKGPTRQSVLPSHHRPVCACASFSHLCAQDLSTPSMSQSHLLLPPACPPPCSLEEPSPLPVSRPCLLIWEMSPSRTAYPQSIQSSRAPSLSLSLWQIRASSISCLPALLHPPHPPSSLDKLDEILAAAQQTISASESPGPGGLASLGKHRPKGFFATEVGSLAWGGP